VSAIDLEFVLSDPALVRVWEALPNARLVGGVVRDLLVGAPVSDIDLATPDAPDMVEQKLAAAGIKSVPTGLAHGTLTAVVLSRGFEITSLRRDVATDGRHARVAFTADWREDAARRDFTCNAMSVDHGGTLHDFFGGEADLRAGLVRFVGDPAQRLAEDYLRLLRFFRFQARFGSAPPDAATRQALSDAVPGLARLSVERVWHELKRILATPDPRAAIGVMDDLGVLAAALPEGTAPERLATLIAAGAPVDPMLRLAALLDGDTAALANRLRLSGAERDRLAALRSAAPEDGADDDALRRALADTPRDVLIDRTWLAGRSAALRDRIAALTAPVFPLQGRDLADAGMAPGPEIGRRLAELRTWWWQGGCLADRAACLAECAKARVQ
jgi:poly(A) polymerase